MLTVPKVLVVVPTYNESDNILKLIDRLVSLKPRLNVLVVDDDSPDNTAILVEDFLAKNQQLKDQVFLLKRKPPRSFALSYQDGFKFALSTGHQAVVQMDSDFSHDPESVWSLVNTLFEKQCDLVIGSRYIDGIRIINWSIHRLFLSYMASIYIRLVTQMPIYDATGGFKCIRCDSLEEILSKKIKSNGYAFQIEVNFYFWKKKKKIVEYPIIFYERRVGQSKMQGKIVIEAVLRVLLLKVKSWFTN